MDEAGILCGEICRLIREEGLHLIIITVCRVGENHEVIVDVSAAPRDEETTNYRLALLLSSPPSWPMSAALYGAGMSVDAAERATLYTALHWAGMSIFLEREPPGKDDAAPGTTMVFGPAGVSFQPPAFARSPARSIFQRFRETFAS